MKTFTLVFSLIGLSGLASADTLTVHQGFKPTVEEATREVELACSKEVPAKALPAGKLLAPPFTRKTVACFTHPAFFGNQSCWGTCLRTSDPPLNIDFNKYVLRPPMGYAYDADQADQAETAMKNHCANGYSTPGQIVSKTDCRLHSDSKGKSIYTCVAACIVARESSL